MTQNEGKNIILLCRILLLISLYSVYEGNDPNAKNDSHENGKLRIQK